VSPSAKDRDIHWFELRGESHGCMSLVGTATALLRASMVEELDQDKSFRDVHLMKNAEHEQADMRSNCDDLCW
jgi:hypothetical protein